VRRFGSSEEDDLASADELARMAREAARRCSEETVPGLIEAAQGDLRVLNDALQVVRGRPLLQPDRPSDQIAFSFLAEAFQIALRQKG
jgi:DNA transposition AAA+ family ATPase